MAKQKTLDMAVERKLETVERYEFEPIKGYPMLHWKGKRPFRGTQFFPAQLKENHGEPVDGWMNRIYWGDNLQVMSHLLKEFRGKVDLVYIDPPFDSKAEYKKKVTHKGQNVTNEISAFEEKQYSDIWSNDEYLQYMYERLILMRELLSDSGSIAVHCDSNKGHQIRVILDEIFGEKNFVNDVTWYYENKPQFGFMKHLPHDHDYIYVYAKSFGQHTLNHQQVPVKVVQKQAIVDWDPVLKKRIAKRDENGDIIYETRSEKYMGSVWTLPLVHPIALERTGYPTQKPEVLLERITTVYSQPGDLVLDMFMGSGTTAAACMKLGRRFIGADINMGAIQTTVKRLLASAEDIHQTVPELEFKIDGETKKIETFYSGFAVYNVNQYDIFRNEMEAKDLLIQALEIQPLPGNSIYDGEKDGRMVKMMPLNRIATRADLSSLIANFDYKEFDRRKAKHPNKPVEHLLIVCMGHEPDLGALLKKELQYTLDVEIVDILRDKQDLQFKREAEAKVVKKKGELVIEQFYPMNLLQKLSVQKENVEDWRELVESVMVDWNYDGGVFEPKLVDVPEKNELVKGSYPIPKDAGTIKVKITDLLSESLEIELP